MNSLIRCQECGRLRPVVLAHEPTMFDVNHYVCSDCRTDRTELIGRTKLAICALLVIGLGVLCGLLIAAVRYFEH